MNIIIIGAGMAGLIAANMLRRHNVRIWERSPTLPSNHTAVLRFRTTEVSDATGIPFSQEVVHKGFWKEGGVVNEVTIEDMNRYSLIVTGGHLYQRSVFNLNIAQRWCAPRDFVEQMARKLDIELGIPFIGRTVDIDAAHIISTIPMPVMMKMYDYEGPEFKSLPVWTVRCQFRSPISKVCQTLYQTEPENWYRATIHGQEITLEFMFDPTDIFEDLALLIVRAVAYFGIHPNYTSFHLETKPQVNRIPIGKILPIDEAARKRFMLWLTEKQGIYSLGRFATWRNILLDDIVKDVKKIETMIETGNTYEQRKKA